MPQTNPSVSLLTSSSPKDVLLDREANLGRVLRRCIGLLTVLVLALAVLAHFIHPWVFIGFYAFYFLWSLSLLFESTIFFLRGKKLVKEYSEIDWERKCRDLTGESARILSHLVHLIILPNYKESFETLSDSMQILAEHSSAKEKYIVALAMEEAEADCKVKADQLVAKFQDSFLRIVVTVHPKNLPGETRGKAPNVSWCVESCKKMLCEYRMEDILVTVCDADTHFINDYFACLSYKFATIPDRTKVIFGIPISFYQNALDVPAPVRVADMVWQITVLQQLTTGRSVRFPCSTYSLSMDLCNAVGYWDKTPEAIGEDAHMFLKCLFKTSGEARIETVWVPAGCYNVCDDTWFGSIKARYNQMYRHLWGTFDLAYIIQQSLIMKNMKFSLKALAFYEMLKVRILPPTLTLVLAVLPNVLKLLFPVYQTGAYSWALRTLYYFQLLCLIPYIGMAVYYEILHKIILNQHIARGTALPCHKRTAKHFMLDWVIFPVVSLFFLTVCSIHVQFNQFFTDSITYEVAPKPTANNQIKPLEEVVLSGTP